MHTNTWLQVLARNTRKRAPALRGARHHSRPPSQSPQQINMIVTDQFCTFHCAFSRAGSATGVVRPCTWTAYSQGRKPDKRDGLNGAFRPELIPPKAHPAARLLSQISISYSSHDASV